MINCKNKIFQGYSEYFPMNGNELIAYIFLRDMDPLVVNIQCYMVLFLEAEVFIFSPWCLELFLRFRRISRVNAMTNSYRENNSITLIRMQLRSEFSLTHSPRGTIDQFQFYCIFDCNQQMVGLFSTNT